MIKRKSDDPRESRWSGRLEVVRTVIQTAQAIWLLLRITGRDC